MWWWWGTVRVLSRTRVVLREREAEARVWLGLVELGVALIVVGVITLLM